MTGHEWLTAAEVAEQMKVSRVQINVMAARGDLPGVKFGRFWRFRSDLFEQWVERRINPDPRARTPHAEAARRRSSFQRTTFWAQRD